MSAPRVPRLAWPFKAQQPAQDLQHQADELQAAPDVVIPAFLAPLPCVCGFVNCPAGRVVSECPRWEP